MKNDRNRASRKAARRYNVSPVARAVRGVLTISAAALMFSGTGLALAKSPAAMAPVPTERARLTHEFAPVADLTTIRDEWTPKSVVEEGFDTFAAAFAGGDAAFASTEGDTRYLGAVADLTTLLPGTYHSGPGGVSGTSNVVGGQWDFTGTPTANFSGSRSDTSIDGFATSAFVTSGTDVVIGAAATTVTTTGQTWAAAWEIEGAANTTFNHGGTATATVTGDDGVAFALYVNGVTSATINNSGTLTATGTGARSYATGALAMSIDGDAAVNNTGTIDATSFVAIGAHAYSYYGDATATNAAGHTITAKGDAASVGLWAYTYYGTATVDNAGTIDSSANIARGAWANGAYAVANNSGTIGAYGDAEAIGLQAQGFYAADLLNIGTVNASATGYAFGLHSQALGDASATNGIGGVVNATAVDGSAYAAFVNSQLYSATVDNFGTLNADGGEFAAGVAAIAGTSVDVLNEGTINATTHGPEGFAVGVIALGGDVTIDNDGRIDATGFFATGVDVRASGNVSIDNSYVIDAEGFDATGISASTTGEAVHVGIVNSNDVYATGTSAYGGFATGIAAVARGYHGSASVSNTGRVLADAKYGGGDAQGVVVSADMDATVDNTNLIGAIGGTSAYAVLALSADGDTIVHNAGGVIAVAGDAREGIAYGVAAQTNTGLASVVNDGAIYAIGMVKATGVYAAAKWNDVEITNNELLVASARYGSATGAIAISYTGDATATNADGATVNVSGATSAGGVRAISLYGDAHTVNDGDVIVSANIARGLTARALYGEAEATIVNNGNVTVYGGASAWGAWALADYYGTASVENTTDATITAIAYTGEATGVRAAGAYYTDVLNAGTIEASGYATATGVLAVSYYTDATVRNGGDIIANAYTGSAIGMRVNANYGHAIAVNSTLIDADSTNGRGTGILAVGDFVDATNAGMIEATGGNGARGISALGATRANIVNNGDIVASAGRGSVFGTYAYSGNFVHSVNNGTIDASVGSGRATGVYAYAFGRAELVNCDCASIDVHADAGTAYGMLGFGTTVATLDNNGDIDATTGGGAAFGLFSMGSTTYVNNNATGTIHAYADAGNAIGAYTSSVHAYIGNAGHIRAIGTDMATGLDSRAMDDGSGATVLTIAYNAGAIYASATSTKYGVATGIRATSDGDSIVTNALGGDIQANARRAYGVLSVADSGLANVFNHGDIHANSTAIDGAAFGIVASGYDVASVASDGAIYAVGKYAVGMEADAYLRTASVVNVAGGTVGAESFFGQAVGMIAQSELGDAVAINAGTLLAYSELGVAMGIVANADNAEAGAWTDPGSITRVESTYGYAGGIALNGDTAYAKLAGTIDVSGARSAVGLGFAAGSGATILNDATITVVQTGAEQQGGPPPLEIGEGQAFGIVGDIQSGVLSIANGGTVDVTAVGAATGIAVYGPGVTVNNSGTIVAEATADLGNARAVVADADDVVFANDGGAISAIANDFAIGVVTYGALTNTTGNAGSIDAEGGTLAVALAGYGVDVAVSNAGDIAASASHEAIGVKVRGETASFANDGHASATATGLEGNAYAVEVFGFDTTFANDHEIGARADGENGFAIGALIAGEDTLDASNGGSITASAFGPGGQAIAMAVYGDGTVSVDNGGDVYALAEQGAAIGAMVSAYGHAAITNGGTIQAHAAGETIGLRVAGDNGASIGNGGTIAAIHADYAVALDLDAGDVDVDNGGTIASIASIDGSIAIRGHDGVESIANSGTIQGALLLDAGDDLFDNAAGGTWNVSGTVTDFGDGDDAIVNAGTIVLANAGIGLGSHSGAGNTFANTGVVLVDGDSHIDMGTGALLAAASNGPASAPVAVLNPLAFENNGTISFLDGAPDDTLTIAGDFAGEGALNVDVSLLNGTSDMLYVDGNIASSSVQTLNVALLDMIQDTDGIDIPVVGVRGESAAGNVVPGSFDLGVVKWSPSNFIDLDLSINQHAAESGSMFAITVVAGGINDTGSLAASIASGAHSLLASQVGTFRQRMGTFAQLGNGDTGAWVRVFGDKGTIDPQVHLDNLPQGGAFKFDQTNSGIEAGVNALITDGWSIGASIGSSQGKQDLVDGFGRDDIDGTTLGGYLTWVGDKGYADFSYRWMHFEAEMTSAGGVQDVDGDAGALNIEAGWNAWTSASGMSLIPQVQYTRADVSDIDPVHGALTDFVIDGGSSSRGRIGLELQQTFKATDGTSWTPYGVLSAVREFEGENRFEIGNVFTGHTSTKGTSAQVEFGVNARIGRADVWGGVNWTDGGALDSFLGGQIGVRYTW